jgi:nicotinamide-nucleotide amidase
VILDEVGAVKANVTTRLPARGTGHDLPVTTTEGTVTGLEASGPEDSGPEASGATARIAEILTSSHRSAAVAESLTGGAVSARLSAIEGASGWYRGGVVAYDEEVKFRLLGVDRGPVITATAARQMATGVARLLDADVAVATTGVGGPGSQEGQPQGTVYLAVHADGASSVRKYHFPGDPAEVVAQAARQALDDLAAAVTAPPAESSSA